MPQVRSWEVARTDGSFDVYVYVQSKIGNYALHARKVGDVLETSQRTPIGANLSNVQVEALFAHE